MANETVQPPLVNNDNDRSIHRIQLKVPPFWKKNPKLWFQQLEAQFITSGISTEATKFNHVVGVIETDVLDFVSDLVLSPPTANQYQAIKTRLIKQFSATEYQNLKSLLEELSLGDRKPSDLLRKMRELAGGKVNEEFLQTLWLQRLPSTIHAFLATNPGTLNDLATLADKMFEVTQASTSVQAVKSTSNFNLDDLTKIVRKLESKIDSINRNYREPRQSTGQKESSRSKTPIKASVVSKKSSLCHYHQRYGTKAKRCKTPCSWVNNKCNNSKN